MAWMNLAKLLSHLRQRRIDPRDITVFVDDHIIDPRRRRPLSSDFMPEGEDDTDDDTDEED